MTTVPASSSERVANGAQLLDEKMHGWYRQIDLSAVYTMDSLNCICGQLGGYEAVGELLSGIAYDDQPAWGNFVNSHGFCCGGTGDINEEWRLAIRARLDADALTIAKKEMMHA